MTTPAMRSDEPLKTDGRPSVGQGIGAETASWTFDDKKVAQGFDEHVRRSVPLYDLGHQRICQISDWFLARDGAVCYELGTSTGALLAKLAEHHAKKPFSMRFVGIDCSTAMIAKARERLSGFPYVSVEQGDITTYPLQPADFIVSYYTMQFVAPAVRQDVFNAIYRALRWGGGFILFERVRASDARFQDMMRTLYEHDFKLEQGFTPSEIVAKTQSLKGTMEPFSNRGNLDLLERAGFKDIEPVLKDVGIAGWIAIK